MTTQAARIATETLLACTSSGDFDRLREVLGPDTILDATVPGWRFQRQGPDDITAQYREWYPVRPTRMTWKLTPAEWGCVAETEEERVIEGRKYYSRNVWLAFEQDGRLSRLVLYCPGDWDEETVERQRREAPMVEAQN